MRQEILNQLSEITPEEQSILRGEALDFSVYNHLGNAVMEPGTLLPEGELFGIRTHTRFVDFPRHGHQYVEMIYQVQGDTHHIIDGAEKLTLKEGQLLLLSLGTEHEIRAAGASDIAVNFFLIPTFFDNAAISLGDTNALAVFLRANMRIRAKTTGHLLFDVSRSPMTENLLENLILGELEHVGIQLQQTTLELLLRHLSGMSQQLVVHTRKEQDQAIVLSILAQIEQRVSVNLSDEAKRLGYDVTVLSRMIRRYTGCTFTELLHTARFNRAVTLLRDTDLSVADIAASIGYENTAFFYRRFFEKFGCTPAEYRSYIRRTE